MESQRKLREREEETRCKTIKSEETQSSPFEIHKEKEEEENSEQLFKESEEEEERFFKKEPEYWMKELLESFDDVESRRRLADSLINRKQDQDWNGVFCQRLETIVNNSIVSCNISRVMDNRELHKDTIEKFRINPYVLMRHEYDLPSDLIKKLEIMESVRKNEYMAEADDTSFFSKTANGIWNKIKGLAASANENSRDFVKSLVDKIVDAITGIVGFVTDVLDSVLIKMKIMLYRLLCAIIPVKWLQTQLENAKTAMTITAIVMIFVSCYGLAVSLITHVMTWRILEKIEHMLGSRNKVDYEDYTSESGDLKCDKVQPLIVRVLSSLLGLDEEDEGRVFRRMRLILSAVSLGTVVFQSSKLLFFLLPTGIKSALMYKFGTREQIYDMEFEDLRARALSLLKVSKIPSVLISPEYKKAITEVMKEMDQLISQGKCRDRKSEILSIYARLLQVQMMLMKYQESSKTRRVPFGIHIAGKGGVGKTKIAPTLLWKVFGIKGESVYYKPCGSEYWDGFLNQRAIVIDEFLIGKTTEEVQKAVAEYLQLCSSGTCMPACASVDDPVIGLKGTTATPEVVLTINNTRWNQPAGIDDTVRVAFTRRRNCVIEVVLKENARMKGATTNVDLLSYTAEECEKAAWARFHIYSGEFSRNQQPIVMDFDDLVTFLEAEYENHQRVQDLMISQEDDEKQRPPIDVINDALRQTMGFPKKPPTILEAILDLFKSEAQGPQSDEETKEWKEVERKKRKGKKPLSPRPSQNQEGVSDKSDSEQTTVKEVVGPAGSGYETCDESSYDPRQKTTIFNGQHEMESGVQCDMTKLHRHECAHLCGNVITHKHPKQHKDPLLCRNCRMDGCPCHDACDVSRMKGETDEQYVERLTNITWDSFSKFHGTLMLRIREHLIGKGRRAPENGTSLFGYVANKMSWKMVNTVAMTITAYGVGWALKKFLFPDTKDEEVTFVSESPRKSGNVSRNPRRGRARFVKFGAESPSGPYDTLELSFGTYKISGFGLGKRTGLFYAHGFHSDSQWNGKMPDDTAAILSVNGKPHDVRISHDDMTVAVEQDWVLVNFRSTRLPQFKDAMKKIIKASEYANIDTVSVEIRGEKICYSNLKRVYNREYRSNAGVIELADCLVGSYPSAKGHCGAVAVITSGMYIGKILGIHVAGTSNKSLPVNYGIVAPTILDDIREAMEEEMPDIPEDHEFVSEGRTQVVQAMEFAEDLEKCPNVESVEIVPLFQQVHLPTKSKIRPSVLRENLPWETQKQPPVLVADDDRRKEKVDPIEVALTAAAGITSTVIDQGTLDTAEESCYKQYKECLNFPIGLRPLTFEEACQGIPGVLSAIDTRTSPGYPLIYVSVKRGKQDFIWFDHEGKFHYQEGFKDMVETVVSKIRDGESIDHVYLGYLKDELRKEAKIEGSDTRVIWASSLISTVAFRMMWGSLLLAFNNSPGKIPAAIGINQYSGDMQVVYDYLAKYTTTKFIAGDYKQFDMHHHPDVRKSAYRILEKLAEPLGYPACAWETLVRHETETPSQIGPYRVNFKSYHMSGCFWTTILNCLVNELYFRYAFARRFPTLTWSDNVRMVCLGDDHVVAPSDEISWDGRDVKKVLEEELGQEYTSADKESDPGPVQTFDQITFLGAHPRRAFGSWTGACKLSTLREMNMWTRDKDMSVCQIAEQSIYMASQWDRETFEKFESELLQGFSGTGLELDYPSYSEVRRVQFMRRACEGMTYNSYNMDFSAEGNESQDEGTMGLTHFSAKRDVIQPHPEYVDKHKEGLNEGEYGLHFGTSSFVQRKTITWSTEDSVGKILASIPAPWGMLTGDTDPVTLQNMPFERHIYWRGETALKAQTNGQRFSQGACIMYWRPFDEPSGADLENVFNNKHEWIIPNANSTKTIVTPYCYTRNVLNTFTASTGTPEILGYYVIQVISPLKVVMGASSVRINLSTAFPNSKFYLPRPLNQESGNSKRMFAKFSDWAPEIEKVDREVNFIAEGNSSSVTNNVRMENVVGSSPIEFSNDTDLTTKVDPQVTATVPMSAAAKATPAGRAARIAGAVEDAIGMARNIRTPRNDNPAVAGGGIPVANQFPSMSKSIGVEPTVGLQLHQSALYRNAHGMTSIDEMSIEELCSKPSLMKRVQVTGDTAPGAVLAEFELNSIGKAIDPTITVHGFPTFLHVLNQFTFWRADWVWDVRCVRAAPHSMRARSTVAFGAPDVKAGEESVYINKVMEFHDDVGDDGDGFVERIVIPYNQQTAYLRTWDGNSVADPIQDYSMGKYVITLVNELQYPSTVPGSVELLVFASLRNVSVAVPKPNSISFGTDRSTVVSFEAEGDDPVNVANEGDVPGTADVAPSEHTPLTETTLSEKVMPHCQIAPGEKFEYTVKNILDILRRHRLQWRESKFVPIKINGIEKRIDAKTALVENKPLNQFQCMFAAWTGTMKYRFFVKGNAEVCYIPASEKQPQTKYDFVPHLLESDQTIDDLSCSNKSHSQYYADGVIPPRERAYPLPGNQSWIDVSAPFTSHLNFIANRNDTLYKSTGMSVGKIYVTTFQEENPQMLIYVGFGDDARLMGFYNPKDLRMRMAYLGEDLQSERSVSFGCRAVTIRTESVSKNYSEL